MQVSGLPDGATSAIAPPTVNSGGSVALTLRLAAATRSGLYPVTVTATAGGTARRASAILTVPGAPGCAGTDTTPVAIPDAGPAVYGTIVISGCPRASSPTATVAVDIQHTWRGDLVIDLVAPDGSAYRWKNADSDSSDNVRETYTVDVSAEVAEGAWAPQGPGRRHRRDHDLVPDALIRPAVPRRPTAPGTAGSAGAERRRSVPCLSRRVGMPGHKADSGPIYGHKVGHPACCPAP